MNNQTGDDALQPMVTVVVPTFNRPGYLKEALRSALAQSYRNLEILVRDNASDPATAEVVQSFKDERIQYLRHPQNIGMTANLIGAFRAAKGKYVTNLHDDDFWDPQYLQKMVGVLEAHPEAVLAFSDHYIVDRSGQIRHDATNKNTAAYGRASLAPGLHKPFKKLALIHLSVPMATATVLRRESIDWADFPNLVCAYDFWLMYLACRDGGAGYYLPERLTYYRVHPTSETALGRGRLSMGFIEIYQRMLGDKRVAEFHDVFRKDLHLHHREAGFALLGQGDRDAARKMLTSGKRYGFDLKSQIAYAATYLPAGITRRLPGKLRFSENSAPMPGTSKS